MMAAATRLIFQVGANSGETITLTLSDMQLAAWH